MSRSQTKTLRGSTTLDVDPEVMKLHCLAALMRWALGYVVTAPIGVVAGLVYVVRVRRGGAGPWTTRQTCSP